MDCCELGDWCKGVKIVNAGYLGKSLCDEVGLILDDVSSCILLHMEDPLGSYDIGIGSDMTAAWLCSKMHKSHSFVYKRI